MTDPKTPTARQQRTSTLSRARILCVLVVAGLLGTASAIQAATVQWNPNPESDIAGYKLSYGTQTGVYTTSVDTGNVTTWNLTLTPGTRYFVVLQAYNTGGLYSPYSAEVIYDAPPAPTLTSLSPASGPVATAVTISGSNFGCDQRHQHRHVQRHHGNPDQLVDDEHRRRQSRPARRPATSWSPSVAWRATR